MREVNRRNSVTEKVFITDDRKEFTYRCEARQHEIKTTDVMVNSIKKGTYRSELGDAIITEYKICEEEEMEILNKYFALLGINLIEGIQEYPIIICLKEKGKERLAIARDKLVEQYMQEVNDIDNILND